MENIEINNLMKIVGLKYQSKYENETDLDQLRYGKIMIMADQVSHFFYYGLRQYAIEIGHQLFGI